MKSLLWILGIMILMLTIILLLLPSPALFLSRDVTAYAPVKSSNAKNIVVSFMFNPGLNSPGPFWYINGTTERGMQSSYVGEITANHKLRISLNLASIETTNTVKYNEYNTMNFTANENGTWTIHLNDIVTTSAVVNLHRTLVGGPFMYFKYFNGYVKNLVVDGMKRIIKLI